jgi:D-inositol-3-phosphate glycosyltransferase
MRSNKKFNNRIALIEPSGGYSGMQYYNIGMANGLIFNGAKPFLFSSSCENLVKTDYEVIYNYFDKVWTVNGVFFKFYFYFIGLTKSVIEAKKKYCNVVHLHQFHLNLNFLFTIVICKLFFRKLIVTIHDVESFDKKKNRFKFIFSSILILLVDKFIVHNKSSFLELSKVIKSNSAIIGHGNYIPFFKAKPYVSKNKKFNILFFGLIKETKGLDILLESLIVLKDLNLDFKLTVAGRPWRNDFSKYQNIINENKLQDNVTTFLHFISEIDLVKHFDDCDIVVLPYRKIFQSGVVLKAMSFKRAVLCSSLPAFEELVIDGFSGYIFERGNSNSLSDKLKQIISDRNGLEKIVENAYKVLENDFNWNNISFELNNLYKNVYEKC